MIPPRKDLKELFEDENTSIQFLFTSGIIKKPLACIECGNRNLMIKGKRWRCTIKSCGKSTTIFKGSFFASHRLKANEILELGYYWVLGMNYLSIQRMTGHSSKTVSAFLRYFRELVGDSLNFEDFVVGGEGIIVEIDEAKFGKRKFNVGHRVNGAWVLGGVERTPERKVFLVEVADRKQETLLDVISRHVKEGYVIFTDRFKSYHNLHELFEHKQVNHSLNFRDPISGCHTNTIEGTWNGVKLNIAPRSRTTGEINDHLSEFIWRRRHNNNLWTGLIEALKEIEYF